MSALHPLRSLPSSSRPLRRLVERLQRRIGARLRCWSRWAAVATAVLLAAGHWAGAAPAGRTPFRLSVDEAATRARLEEGAVTVFLALANATGRDLNTRVEAEILDPAGQRLSRIERTQWLAADCGSIALRLPLPAGKAPDAAELVAWRLHYRLSPAPPAGEKEAVGRKAEMGPADDMTRKGNPPLGQTGQGSMAEGTLSVGRAMTDLFRLRLVRPWYSCEGEKLPIRIQAYHPLSLKSVAGVEVTVDLRWDDETGCRICKTALTGGKGLASVTLPIPPDAPSGRDADLIVRGRKGLVTQRMDQSIEIFHWDEVLLSTDKPLYQPGQCLHARILAWNSSHRILAGRTFTLRILNHEDDCVFSADLTTSKQGIASTEWPIPVDFPLGDYDVQLKKKSEDEDSDVCASNRIRISRYDLPQFAVQARPTRPYYHPGESPTVEIQTDYLFGQPVSGAAVKIVREFDRKWNSERQRWEIEEREPVAGRTGPDGRCQLAMPAEEDSFDERDWDYRRFYDLDYCAQVTDPSTSRTETRRFSIRYSRDDIHVYLVGWEPALGKSVPGNLYVSTFYPDGRPAECDVAILAELDRWDHPRRLAVLSQTPLDTLRTNRYGIGKATGIPPLDDSDIDRLLLKARDREGRTGWASDNIYGNDDLRIELNRAVLRPGESIEARILSKEPIRSAAVELVGPKGILHSRQVSLRNCRAEVLFAYENSFHGMMSLIVTPLDKLPERGYLNSERRSMIYPTLEDELSLEVRPRQSSPAPGDEAVLECRVQSRSGDGVPATLGLTMLDQAVLERALQEMGPGSIDSYLGDYRRAIGDDERLGEITLPRLLRLDPERPIPPEMELTAEALLFHVGSPSDYLVEEGRSIFPDLEKIQAEAAARPLQPLASMLDRHFPKDGPGPVSAEELRTVMCREGIVADRWRDPWDNPYRLTCRPEGALMILRIVSAGPDEQWETPDDLTALAADWQYFRDHGIKLNEAARDYADRTGRPILSYSDLRAELRRMGEDFDAWRDPWGHPLRASFQVRGGEGLILVQSPGDSRGWNAERAADWAPTTAWTSKTDYFLSTGAELRRILRMHLAGGKPAPGDVVQYQNLLDLAQLPPGWATDVWGQPYYVRFQRAASFTIPYEPGLTVGFKPGIQTVINEKVIAIEVRSAGPDGERGTVDDFQIDLLPVILHPMLDLSQVADSENSPTSARGPLYGAVMDQMGGIIPGVTVSVINESTGEVESVLTDDSGEYSFPSLATGAYQVKFELEGFMPILITGVMVSQDHSIFLPVALRVSEVTAEVCCLAEGPPVCTCTTTIGCEIKEKGNTQPRPISTPRVREYFPETLLWVPELPTDARGRATVRVKLADSLTTWRVAAVASTADGRVAVAECDLPTFQPFMVDAELPPLLTEGDELDVPAVVRNYLEDSQDVTLAAEASAGLERIGAAPAPARVEPGGFARRLVGVRAAAPAEAGRLQVTGTARDGGDAVARTAAVRPDGREIVRSAGTVLDAGAELRLDVPASALPGTVRAAVKVYPSLEAHVAESIEGILGRPDGCCEQIVSAAYPNLLALRLAGAREEPAGPLSRKAWKYLWAGLERLADCQTDSGGFAYWSRHGEPDLPLTAYALRFLLDAAPWADPDEPMAERAAAWLLDRQEEDGSWPAPAWWGQYKEAARIARTAGIARLLARPVDGATSAPLPGSFESRRAAAVRRALAFLKGRMDSVENWSVLADYTLAVLADGQAAEAQGALERLRAGARQGISTCWWEPAGGTLFYGCGLAGRIEATARTLEALVRAGQAGAGDSGDAERTSRALLFLLEHQDRLGTWGSTQATVAVLDALVALQGTAAAQAPGEIEVLVDGRPAGTVSIPAGEGLALPVTLDLSGAVGPGPHTVALRRASGAGRVTVQATASCFVPWDGPDAAEPAGRRPLFFQVGFDRTEAAAGDTVTCRVQAGRRDPDTGAGERGGMLLGEVGLPPGADVDRAALDRAVAEPGSGLCRYELQPDRVVVYLWPRGRDALFTFTYRPRLGLRAQTPASLLYDYYNPDLQIIRRPVRFTVLDKL